MTEINIPIYGVHKKEIEEGKYIINEYNELYRSGNPNHHFTFFNFNITNFIKSAKQYYKDKHIVYKKEYDDRYEEYLYYVLNKYYDILFSNKEYAVMKQKGDRQYANYKQTTKETTQVPTI